MLHSKSCTCTQTAPAWAYISSGCALALCTQALALLFALTPALGFLICTLILSPALGFFPCAQKQHERTISECKWTVRASRAKLNTSRGYLSVCTGGLSVTKYEREINNPCCKTERLCCLIKRGGQWSDTKLKQTINISESMHVMLVIKVRRLFLPVLERMCSEGSDKENKHEEPKLVCIKCISPQISERAVSSLVRVLSHNSSNLKMDLSLCSGLKGHGEDMQLLVVTHPKVPMLCSTSQCGVDSESKGERRGQHVYCLRGEVTVLYDQNIDTREGINSKKHDCLTDSDR